MTNNPQQLWKKVLQDIETEVSKANYFLIFKQTSLDSLIDGTATITAPSHIIINLLKKRFQETIKKHLDKNSGKNITLSFVVKTLPVTDKTETNSAPLFAQTATPAPLAVGHLPRVRSDFTFQTFAVSGSNQLALVSSQRVATNPGASYNPFFIYGPVGVGKTHLMHAIANEIYQKQPDKKIVYITSEEFTNEVVEAIRTNNTAAMKKRFRTALLLLIDDIQFIEGKERVQEELFHTFNILIDQGSQIVLSSDRPPEEIKKLEKRLSSRFAGGLTVDIAPPDFELRTAILMIKANKFNVQLPIEVAKQLAEQATDARTLEGLLLRLITVSTTTNQPITLDLAGKTLGKAVEEQKGHLHSDDIVKAVCDFYRIKSTQLKGPKRNASLVRARQVAMYLLKTQLKLTLAEIGNLLGGRDHTTIIHGVQKIENLVDNKAEVVEDISGINRQLIG